MFEFSKTDLNGFSDAVREALSRGDGPGDDRDAPPGRKPDADGLIRVFTDGAVKSPDFSRGDIRPPETK